MRSRNVAWDKLRIALTVGGGVRESHVTSGELQAGEAGGQPLLEIATQREVFFETGLTGLKLEPVGLFFDIAGQSISMLAAGWLKKDMLPLPEDDPEATRLLSGLNPSLRARCMPASCFGGGRDCWETKKWFAVGGLPLSGEKSARLAFSMLAREIAKASTRTDGPATCGTFLTRYQASTGNSTDRRIEEWPLSTSQSARRSFQWVDIRT
jgi:hypothetical protein